ncbi:MAG: sigma-54 dependent transcriptional regulator [Cytophagaceae bacterium]|nr:sigma-54 dependent transcriptional regulator [Cytophagaceae bacterium]
MNKGNILIIDDEEKLRNLLAKIISLEEYKVFETGTSKAALKILEKEEIEVVISDVKLPDANGLDLIPKIKSLYPHIEIIVMTAFGTIADGVRAIKLGAFDYITKGDGEEQIIPTVSRAMEKAHLQLKVQKLEKKLNDHYSFDNVIGKSSLIRQAIELGKKVALTDASVLLLGETGTGKEIFAQAIHYESLRKQKPFVSINCSAIPKDLLESEMFGYKAGAFTGAAKDKKGLLEEANHGTVFLDEIGEMNLELQAKLLRFLETHSFNKTGDTKETKVNVRIIAATNRDLSKEAENHTFRSDLYYRLAAFTIELPSLKERKEDIESLAEHFIQIHSLKNKKKILGMDKEFILLLKNYSFKGNIRELKNIIERAVILTDSEILSSSLLPLEVIHADETSSSLDLSIIEKNHIRKVLQITQGNKTKTAELLGIGIATLYRKIEEYKL